MKRHLVMSFIISGVLPAVVLSIFYNPISHRNNSEIEIDSDSGQDFLDPSEITSDAESTVMVKTDAGVITMQLEDYVTGVVLGEMPADFEAEALKAQAVVARTYTCKKMKDSKHTNADVCTDSTCCQAYLSKNEFLEKGGSVESFLKVNNAVMDTNGEVLKYNGELIEATYFSCSGGKTETAKEVWGGDIPYLQSVESPGEEIASHYMDTVKFSPAEFRDKLGINYAGNPEQWIGNISYTEGGGVETIVIGGKPFTGVQFRKLLNLRSTAFVITAVGDSITITTKGFGHRVGMSQYGAEAMAIEGKDYKSILEHYYQGAILSSIIG